MRRLPPPEVVNPVWQAPGPEGLAELRLYLSVVYMCPVLNFPHLPSPFSLMHSRGKQEKLLAFLLMLFEAGPLGSFS